MIACSIETKESVCNEIVNWYNADPYSFWFTLITVLVSGLISWLISAIYYSKGNRINLKLSVIIPIKEILNKERSIENYKELCEIVQSYNVRFMRKNEKKALYQLKESYELIHKYLYEYVNAEILYDYFEYTLERNGIDFKPVPVDIDGEVVYYEPPQDIHYLTGDIERILRNCDIDFETEKCERAVSCLFRSYYNDYYTSEEVKFFDDFSILEVIEKSKTTKEWNEKFKKFKKAKENFMNLKIVIEC